LHRLGVAECFEHLLTVPVAWAGLDALTASRAWRSAIGRSLMLIVRHWPLALAVVYREMLRRDAPAAPVSAVVEFG
jgi:hypothetical protein